MTGNLFDMAALMRNRRRAKLAVDPALFLQRRAAVEISERLTEVNRTFNSPVVVTSFPEIWKDIAPKTQTVPEADVLNLDIGAHDLVVHAMSLHWSNDPVGQIIQCKRALKPDGLFLATLFGGQTLHELRSALAEAETAVSGGLSPRVAPMGELRDLGGLIARAGLALPVADSDLIEVTYADMAALMRDLRDMGEVNVMSARPKAFTRRTVFDAATDIYRNHFSTPEGRLKATFEIIHLAGWAVSETQQKPLQPGSATTRLADVLGTIEFGQDTKSGA